MEEGDENRQRSIDGKVIRKKRFAVLLTLNCGALPRTPPKGMMPFGNRNLGFLHLCAVALRSCNTYPNSL